QLCRKPPAGEKFANTYKLQIGVLAQVLILALVFTSAINAGQRLGETGAGPGISEIIVMMGSCVLLHFAGLAAGHYGSRFFGFNAIDATAVIFSGSQKTLPIAVLLAT